MSLSIDLAEFAEDTLAPELQGATETAPYYDGLVFRAYADGTAMAVPEATGRGGRYDRLFRRLGADLAAVGFSVSPDRLLGSDAAPSAAPESKPRRAW